MLDFRTKKIRPSNGEIVQVAILGDMDFSTWCDDGSNPLEFLKPILSTTDIVVANVETVLSDQPLKSNKYGILLKSPTRCATFLKEIGVNYALLANNHIDDFGIEGVDDTIKALTDNEIDYFGLSSRNDVIVDKKGIKFQLAGFGTIWQDISIVPSYGQTPGEIYTKFTSDDAHLLYFVHGFEELYSVPFPWRLELLRTISKEVKPAALICGHSHCYQGWVNLSDAGVTCLSYGNGFMNLGYHAKLNKSSTFGCCSILHFDQQGCFQIDEYLYKISLNGLENISRKDADEIWTNLSLMHELIKNTDYLEEAWEKECFHKWKPRGVKNLPIIRRFYDRHRGLFPIKLEDNITVYSRAIRAAYLKQQYGISSFLLKDDEHIRMRKK